MNAIEEKVLAGLPLPVVQRKPSSLTIREARCDIKDGETIGKFKKYLLEEVDEKRSVLPLAGYCFMTGIINALIFSAIFIWCGSQTGNTVQLSLVIARLLDWESDHMFHPVDKQALCSLITFVLGVFIGGRLGDKIGCKTRAWLFTGTFVQALFTMAPAILIWKGEKSRITDDHDVPVWSNTLSFVFTGFLSGSMGLQGVMAKRVNTHFSNTVALTATWCELMSNPKLLDVRRLVTSRDHQILTIACFVAGGFTGRVSIDRIGFANTLGIGAGIRFIISVWWLFAPQRDVNM